MNVPSEDARAYLCVDEFLCTAIDARALKTALELGLIDRLGPETRPVGDLEATFPGDRAGLRLLLDLLRANRVVEEADGSVRLADGFRAALRFRDLLEAKADFANLVAPDFVGLFTDLVVNPGRFMRSARLFELFDYRRCLDPTPENRERTLRWVRFTTALTRYEAPVCLREYDFARHRRMLDVGGNSGEFALRACQAHPHLRAVVADLPVVCDIGEGHLRGRPEADRIAFLRCDARVDPLPPGCDLVTFKSVLHDWPEAEAARLIARAVRSLAPGGTVLIFERAPLELSVTPPYSLVPMLLFFRSFRPPDVYRRLLEEAGCRDVRVRRVDLETPFSLVTATGPG